MSDFKERCFQIREGLKEFEGPIKALLDIAEPSMRGVEGDKHLVSSEMKANVMLAFRHLEDCRMRLGKAIQAYDGGISVYQR